MNILMTICCRGGSKGVKNKNIKPLCGKPLIAHTIAQGKEWGKATAIVVSTDSPEIAAVAESFGAVAPFLRPAHLASDNAPKVPVIRHALLFMENLNNIRYDAVVDLDATSPLRTSADIQGAFELFTTGDVNTVFSVVKAHRNPYFNMVEIQAHGYCALSKKLPEGVYSRQMAPAVYDMNASIYVYKTEYLRNEATVSAISDATKAYIMGDISAYDIDSELDFRYIEYLVTQGLFAL